MLPGQTWLAHPKVTQWPLGVATYRDFPIQLPYYQSLGPLANSHRQAKRHWLCNFQATVSFRAVPPESILSDVRNERSILAAREKDCSRFCRIITSRRHALLKYACQAFPPTQTPAHWLCLGRQEWIGNRPRRKTVGSATSKPCSRRTIPWHPSGSTRSRMAALLTSPSDAMGC